jgi:hypothetical protein
MLSFIVADSAVEQNPFLDQLPVVPGIIIIEPADLDTSESVDPAVRELDDMAMNMSYQLGLQRVGPRLAKLQPAPWTLWASDCCFVCWSTTGVLKNDALMNDHNDAQLEDARMNS